MFQQENFSLNPPRRCEAQPQRASLGYPFHNTAAHMEATPTREGICHASARPPASQSTVPHFPSSLDRMRNHRARTGSHPLECSNQTPPSKLDTAPFSRAKPQPIRGFPAIEPMTF